MYAGELTLARRLLFIIPYQASLEATTEERRKDR
jgi:hypothetical protein